MLVTGASGFAGTHLRRFLETEGHTVLGLDRSENAEIRADVARVDELRRAVVGVGAEGIFHLAGLAYVPALREDAHKAHEVHVGGTRNVLEVARETGLRVLMVSSGQVYGRLGPDELPATESLELRPALEEPYAVSKAEAERLCEALAQTQEVVRVRPFNHTGPGQAPVYVCSDFADQIARCEIGAREPVIKVGDLSAERDFTDVRDVVRAYWLAFSAARPGEVYNVCSGTPVAISHILGLLVSMASVEVRIEVSSERMRPGEVNRFCGSYDKLARETGWKPEIELERTLADLLEDRRQRAAV